MSSFGSDDEVKWEVEPTPSDSVDCPVVSLVVTLSSILVEEESSDEVQDEDESHGFEPSSLDDDLSEATSVPTVVLVRYATRVHDKLQLY